MLDTSIQVKTDHFDGPLGLLLLLVEKEEMNIRELDLTKITKQYLDYLAQMRDLDFDIAGDYLFLASTLLLLKSKVCIAEEELKGLESEFGVEGLNITSQSELIRRLEELQLYQKMGKKLWELEKKGHEIFVKPKVDRKAIVNSILTPMDLNSLTMTMVDFLFRQRRKYTVVKRDRLSIKEKLKFLKTNLKLGEQTTFDTLLEMNGKAEEGKDPTDNIVITFISLLELSRLQRINVFQNEDRSTIYVNVVRSLEDFDVEQANGFEDEAMTAPSASGVQEIKEANLDERLVIEDLGEYTPEPEVAAPATEEGSEELSPEDQEEYMELLTTPDSVDAGSKLIQ
ncbi:segregation/condensation protein A [Bacteriovorax sp. PP10]|uniref:Segregation and condensation protein A n=1 Tax=Bacteriovorax antarcticus TaxID=3088717 RepID=A0ABU5VWG2_9BACT|nr:segregation/condensation protein A [Bacteriovorax sp. PP10]MEA9356684.1 segregation/condensation protein A [Bacteriovorax sp. PP10]